MQFCMTVVENFPPPLAFYLVLLEVDKNIKSYKRLVRNMSSEDIKSQRTKRLQMDLLFFDW